MKAGEKEIKVVFNQERFRPAEVPILLSDTKKIESLGFWKKHTVREIIRDQLVCSPETPRTTQLFASRLRKMLVCTCGRLTLGDQLYNLLILVHERNN